jgi:hypothetical protein
MEKVWVTTSDNPYDYFTEYDKWYEFDESHRYSTSGLVARIARTNNEFSDEQIEKDIERAVTDICRNGGLYLAMVTDDPKVFYKRIERS